MTNGVAAALALSGQILGGRMEWATAFVSWSRHELSGLTTAMTSNGVVGVNMAEGWLTPSMVRDAHADEGHGLVAGPPWHLRAVRRRAGYGESVSQVAQQAGGMV